jgi:hypothetical protein
LFAEELIEQSKFSEKEHRLFTDFVFLLWRRLKEEGALGMDRKNRELYSFETLLSSAPGEAYQIERRHRKLDEYFTFYRKEKRIVGDK